MDTGFESPWRGFIEDAWSTRYPDAIAPAGADWSGPWQARIPRHGPLPPPAPPADPGGPPGHIPRDPGDLPPAPAPAPPGNEGRIRAAMRPPEAIRVLAKMGYGHDADSLARYAAGGSTDAARRQAWIESQLDWTSIDDTAVDARLTAPGYTTLDKPLTQLWAEHVVADPVYDVRMRPAWECQRAAFVRAVHSKRQLRELMVEFWHNHFNVFGTDFGIGPVMPHYDRDVIRANAMGNFRTMLEAVATSTAMLYYLDNVSNSRAGPNENFARELLELHTMGATSYLGALNPFQVPPHPDDDDFPLGYTDIDVYETAAAFTGWSVHNNHWQFPGPNDGTFMYRASWHDEGLKLVLGMYLTPEQPPLKDGRDVLDRLAQHPSTARFVCRKIIQRLVSDEVPETLVASAAQVFRQHWQSADQIVRVLRHILNSAAFTAQWATKQRRPFELFVAAQRAIGTDFTLRVGHEASDNVMWRYNPTGHVPFNWPAPNGYPDVARAWDGSNALAMSWRVLSYLPERTDAGGPILPIVQLSRDQVPVWTAAALVDYWIKRITGHRLPAARRQSLLLFMAQNGDPDSYVVLDTDAWSANDLKRHYNHQRLRTLVSLLLASPEFFHR